MVRHCILSLRAECNEAWQSRSLFVILSGTTWSEESDCGRYTRMICPFVCHFEREREICAWLFPLSCLPQPDSSLTLRMTYREALSCKDSSLRFTSFRMTAQGKYCTKRDSHVGLRPPQNDKLQRPTMSLRGRACPTVGVSIAVCHSERSGGRQDSGNSYAQIPHIRRNNMPIEIFTLRLLIASHNEAGEIFVHNQMPNEVGYDMFS